MRRRQNGDRLTVAEKKRAYAGMLTLLAQGYKNAEISEMTGLGSPTIKSHTSLAYKKLGVNSSMDAVLKAKELGLIGQAPDGGESAE